MFGVIAMIAQIDSDNASLPIQLDSKRRCQRGKVAFGTQEAVQQDDGSVSVSVSSSVLFDTTIMLFGCIKVRPWQGDRVL
jgi:hypothetical protein